MKHHKRALEGPSIWRIALCGVITLAAMVAAGLLVTRPGRDGGHLLGAALGLGLAALMFAHAFADLLELLAARERRMRRERAEIELRLLNTGVWVSPDGERQSVRWDDRDGRWHVLDRQDGREYVWSDPGQIRLMMSELEAVFGWARLDDPATREVCRRLHMAVDDPEGRRDPETTAQRAERGQETVRLGYDRPLPTDERRAAWLDAPTEVRGER